MNVRINSRIITKNSAADRARKRVYAGVGMSQNFSGTQYPSVPRILVRAFLAE